MVALSHIQINSVFLTELIIFVSLESKFES